MAIHSTKNYIGNTVIELDVIDSTNNYAMGLVQKGIAKHGLCVMANEQKFGKGQRNKKWISEPGKNLIFSVVLEPVLLDLEEMFSLSIMSALSVYDLITHFTKSQTSIKYPNDIYWRDRKAGGILIENKFKGTKWQYAVVGVGLNVNQTNFSGDLLNPVSVKQITGADYPIKEVAEKLMYFMELRYEELMQSGKARQLLAYNKYLFRRAEPVKLKNEDTVFSCVVEGVNANGQIMVSGAPRAAYEYWEIEWIKY